MSTSPQAVATDNSNFLNFAKGLKTSVVKEGTSEETLRARRILRAVRYIEGRHLGFISPKSGTWVDVIPEPTDPYYVNNQTKVYVRSLLKEWARSNARLSVDPRDDKMESQGKARVSKHIIELYRDRLFRAVEKHTEAMYAFSAGTYFRKTFWDFTKTEHKDKVPVYEDQNIKVGPDSLFCQSCGYGQTIDAPPQSPIPSPQQNSATPIPPGSQSPEAESQPTIPNYTDDFSVSTETAPCPQCGGEAELSKSPEVSFPQVTGEKEVVTGDINSYPVDPFEVKVQNRARKIKDSTYLLHRVRIDKDVAKSKFPWAKLDNSTDSGHMPLHYQKLLVSSPGNYNVKDLRTQSSPLGSDDNTIELAFLWIDPPKYQDFTFPLEGFQHPCGFQAPGGAKALDLFPEGCRLVFCGDELVDIWAESKNDVWAAGRYFLMPNTFWGSGIEDTHEQQRQLNELESLLLENSLHAAAPPAIYNPLKISGSSLQGKPRARIPLKNPTLSDEPGKYIEFPQGRQLGVEVFNQIEAKKRDLQALFGAFSVVSGMPDVNITTATGMAILRDQALGFLGPPLELKGEMEVDWAYQVLKLCKKYMTGSRFLKFGKYSQVEGVWFSQADIETDLVITVSPDSIFPRNSMERRNDLQEAGTAFGLPMGIWNPAVPTNVRQLAAERYDIPFDADQSLAHQRLQRIELDQMKQAYQAVIAQGVNPVDPMGQPDLRVVSLVASATPPNLLRDDHMVHFEWIRNYLVTDDGLNEDPVIQKVLELHMEMHLQMASQMSMLMGAMQGLPAMGEQGVNPNPDPGTGDQQQRDQKQKHSSPTGGSAKPGSNLPLAREGSTNPPGSRPKPNQK